MIIFIHHLHQDHLYKVDIDPAQPLAKSINAAFAALYPDQANIFTQQMHLWDKLSHMPLNIYQSANDMELPPFRSLIFF